jgi:hypothetical protein
VTTRPRDWTPEDELAELLRPHRPDPSAFRAGVARRAAEREREAAERREAERRHPLRAAAFRRAAALLGAESLAPAAGQAAASKALSTALALPALLFVGAVGGFVLGARSLSRSAREALPPAPEDPTVDPGDRPRRRRRPRALLPRSGSRIVSAVQLASLLLICAPFVFGARYAIDVVMLFLLGAMALFVVAVREMSREVGLERRRVRLLCTVFLTQVVAGALLWTAAVPFADGAGALGRGWCGAVLLAGVVACARGGAPRRWAALGVVAFTIFLNPLGRTASSPASLAAQLGGYDLSVTSLRAWDEAAAVAAALRAVGADPGDLSRVRADVERAIEEGLDAHPVVWTAAAEMGLVDDAHWRALASRPDQARRLDQLLGSNGRIRSDYELYQVPMLLAARALAEPERAALLAAIERSWPAGGHGALTDAAVCVRAWEIAGRPDLADARAADVHRLLVERWIRNTAFSFSKAGGFTSDPEKFRTSFDEPTWHAVRLMARFGVPAEVDARVVRGYLRSQARAFWLFGDPDAYLSAHERASLLLLRGAVELPPRGAVERVLDERLLFASIALVALCLLAIRLTPARE